MIRFGVIKWVQSKEGSLPSSIYEYVNDCNQTHSIICVIMCLVQMTRLLHITKQDDTNSHVHHNDFHGAMKIILKLSTKQRINAFAMPLWKNALNVDMYIGSQQRHTRIYFQILVINQFHRIIKFITINAIKLRLGNCRMGCIVVFMNKYLTICADHWSDGFNYMVC